MDFEGRPAEADAAPLAEASLEDLRRRLLAVEVEAEAEEVARVFAAMASYDRAFREEFGREHDHFRLLGEDNVRRYLPIPSVRVRVHPRDSLFEIFARACAARAAGCPVFIVPYGYNEGDDVRKLDCDAIVASLDHAANLILAP